MNKALLSSKCHKWETPQDLFDALDAVFKFTLDPCCEVETAKCDCFFTPKEDGLAQGWEGQSVFMNPPYGREQVKWVRKAFEESQKGATVVCLIPAKTETRLAHEVIFPHAKAICFIAGRLRFSGSKVNAPFPSWVVVFGPELNTAQRDVLNALGFSPPSQTQR